MKGESCESFEGTRTRVEGKEYASFESGRGRLEGIIHTSVLASDTFDKTEIRSVPRESWSSMSSV